MTIRTEHMKVESVRASSRREQRAERSARRIWRRSRTEFVTNLHPARQRPCAQIGPLIVAQEVSSANPQFRHLNVRHFLATFGGFCPTFLPTFWPFGPQICPKSAFDVQKIDFRPHFFVIFASGSVYGLEMALPRRGLELAVTLIFVDA